jgi:hypothetical protein
MNTNTVFSAVLHSTTPISCPSFTTARHVSEDTTADTMGVIRTGRKENIGTPWRNTIFT